MSETIVGTSVPSETPAGMGDRAAKTAAVGIRGESDAAYWHGLVSGVPVLTLSTHKPRAGLSGELVARSRRIGKNHTEQLRRFSQREGAPLSVVLLSALQALVLRYTSQEDFVIGCRLANLQSAINGTSSPEHPAFLLRVDLSGDPPFRELLCRCHAATLESRMHGRSALADLMEELTTELGVQSPTFQLSFSYENGNLAVEGERSPVESFHSSPDVPVDLHLSVNDSGEDLSLRAFYSQELFDADGIERILNHLEVLLRGAEQNPEQRLSNLPLLTEGERHQVLSEWNQNERDYPRDKCLHQLLEAQAERIPEKVAVAQGERQLSYGEFNRRANQLAHYLRSLGVGKDIKVGICLGPELEFAIAIIGVMKAGAACVPLDPNYPQERLAYMLQDSEARVLITQEGVFQSEVPAGCRTLSLSRLTEALSGQPRTNPESRSLSRPHGVRDLYIGFNRETSRRPSFARGPSELSHRSLRDVQR